MSLAGDSTLTGALVIAAWYYINTTNQKTLVSANPFPGAAAMHISQAAPSQPLTQRTEPKVDKAWKPFS